jgi:hypothetical protein
MLPARITGYELAIAYRLPVIIDQRVFIRVLPLGKWARIGVIAGRIEMFNKSCSLRV